MANGTDRRSEIHLADLIRALAVLGSENQSQAMTIARALGFTLHERQQQEPSNRVYDPHRYPARKLQKRQQEQTRSRPPVPPAPKPHVDLPAESRECQLKRLDDSTQSLMSPPAWLDSGFQVLSQAPAARPAHRQPLFDDNESRGILGAALATQRDGGDLDIRGLIDRVVGYEIIDEIPRLPEASLDRGCQLLLDFGENMVPFWEDLHSLADQVDAILGETELRVFEFDRDPHTAKYWSASNKSEDWRPERGSPVLVATGLGVRGRLRGVAAGAGWRSFVQRCEAAASPLLILLPWEPAFWPADLGNYPTLLHWDRHTSASLIRQRIGIGHRIPQ